MIITNNNEKIDLSFRDLVEEVAWWVAENIAPTTAKEIPQIFNEEKLQEMFIKAVQWCMEE